VLEKARGQWRSILSSVGIPGKYLTAKGRECPHCGGTDRFSWTNYQQEGYFICRQCAPEGGDGWEFVSWFFRISKKDALDRIRQVLMIARPDRQKPKPDMSNRFIRDLWDGAFHIQRDDPVGMYLSSRKVFPGSDPVAIRFHPNVSYFDGKKRIGAFPAMLARFENGGDFNLQVTYLTDDGRKREDVPVARKNMQGAMPKGGAVKLFGWRETLGIAEGVETAIAAAKMAQVPFWACLSANALCKVEVPDGVRNVIIAVDNDESFTGAKYAYALANRLKVLDVLNVTVKMPLVAGDDWNDVLIDYGLDVGRATWDGE